MHPYGRGSEFGVLIGHGSDDLSMLLGDQVMPLTCTIFPALQAIWGHHDHRRTETVQGGDETGVAAGRGKRTMEPSVGLECFDRPLSSREDVEHPLEPIEV